MATISYTHTHICTCGNSRCSVVHTTTAIFALFFVKFISSSYLFFSLKRLRGPDPPLSWGIASAAVPLLHNNLRITLTLPLAEDAVSHSARSGSTQVGEKSLPPLWERHVAKSKIISEKKWNEWLFSTQVLFGNGCLSREVRGTAALHSFLWSSTLFQGFTFTTALKL